MSDTRFTIVGAGPVGTLMAVLLARRGLAVRVIERRADPRSAPLDRGRSINLALAARGLAALEQAGLMPRILPHLVAMSGRMLHDEHGRLQFLRYGGNPREAIHSISRELLNRVLIEAAAEYPTIELEFQARCLDVDPQGGILRLYDARQDRQRKYPFATLLGADGAGSTVRGALVQRGVSSAREDVLEHDYKELVIPAHAGAAQLPGYVFEPRALHIWPRGGHMLIALPNADGSFTATLFLPRHGVVSFDRLHDPRAVRDFFTQQFVDTAGVIPALEQQFEQHPQGHLGSVQCARWQVAGRVLLLGDAAHAIVPFHGQGLNSGFEDCRVLDRLLAAHAEVAPALEQFERERQPDTAAIAAMALENYAEMRAAVRSPDFAQRQALAVELEQRFPERFIPRYSMVMFHPEISYAEAQRRGVLQQRVLDALSARCGLHALDERCESYARELLDQHGL